MILPMRVTPEQEEKRLDLTQHGEEAFDFRTK
jgi:ammonia channel protein AmtB